MNPIYLDYAATTPVAAEVAAAMMPWLAPLAGAAHAAQFGNSGSIHAWGRAAQTAVAGARAQVAALLGAELRDLVFTSGATEANNLAILGLARSRAVTGRHLVTTVIEHKSVLDPCRALQRAGFAISFVAPDADGIVSAEAVRAALRTDTLLVSVMHANNETGAIQPVAEIGRLCRERGIALHVDAAQSAGKLPIDLGTLPVDLLSVSAHKLHGPQGVGALYVRRELRALLEPLLYGGGQERGLRSGTLPVHQLVGFGAAAALAAAVLPVEAARLRSLRDRLQAALLALPGTLLNGHPEQRLPGVLNVSFAGLHGETLLHGMPELALSSSAACNSDSDEPSYVMRALGRDTATAEASLRFSLGRYTTVAEIDTAISVVHRAIAWQRARLPVAPDLAVGVPLEGSSTRVQFELRSRDGLLTQAVYRAYGCPYTHAVCAWLCSRLPGQAPAAALGAGPRAWAAQLQVPPERLGRLLVVEDALRRALDALKNPAQAIT